MKIPRKLKKLIPSGPYCYKSIEAPCKENGYVFKTKPCPFYSRIKMKDVPQDSEDIIMKEMRDEGEFPEEYIGWCKLVKYSVDDQCKSCRVKFP